MKNKNITQKELILSLIRDDLINYKLTSGLDALGLNAENYNLHLGDTIFSLIGFEEGEFNEMVFERIYLGLAEKVKSIDLSNSRDGLDELAEAIYIELLKAREIQNGKK